MITMIFLFLSFLWIVIAVGLILLEISSHHTEGGAFAVAMIIIVFTGLLNIIPVTEHARDLAIIRTAPITTAVREEAIQRINDDLVNFPTESALMNADSPVKSMIETKSKFISDLTELNASIAEAKVSIERRKLGPSAWVVYVVGEK